MLVRAYVNAGRWVADCPRQDCTSAMELTPKQAAFHCAGPFGCQQLADIEWPTDADRIWEVLARRPVPVTRNWAPAGHRQAQVTGHPDGQTVGDLIAENREHGVS